MKIFFIVLISVVAFVQTQSTDSDSKEKRRNAMKVCSEKTNLHFKKSDEYSKAFAEGGNQIQAFAECILREQGFISTTGEILFEEIKKAPPCGIYPEKYFAFVNQCKSEKGNNITETSYKFAKCLIDIIAKTHQEQREKKTRAMKICSDKTNVNITGFENYRKALSEGTPSIQAYSECYLRELGYTDSNGNILYEEIKKSPPSRISYAKYSTFVDQCKNEKGSNASETSYKFSSCIMKTYEEYKAMKFQNRKAQQGQPL
ncbi:hypothetical protein FQA39_LY13192 [Lamprigera yunnana]|nr:hypothetical protein FQA39_LY13192 [Lamprigera yunnana]